MEPVRIVVPLPLPLRTANAWLFHGPVAALVDSGIGTAEGYSALREGLWDSGADANGMDLYATHGHVDHVGNAARLRREFGMRLHVADEEAPHIESFRRGAAGRYAEYTKALLAHGVPPEEVLAMRQRGERMDLWTEDAAVQVRLRDGQEVMLGETPATVHVMPGHTAGSAVFATADNHLLTGDTLLEHITSNAIELTDADRGRYATYLRTLDRMRRFAGMRALPGHHEPFQVTDALIDSHLAKHHARSRRILDRLDREHSAWELVPIVFPHLAGDQAFLGTCEVVGHLHALELEGRIRMREIEGVRRFVRTA